MTEVTEHTPKHMALCTNIKTDDFPFSKILLQPFPWCRTPPTLPRLMGSGKNHCCSYCSHFLPYLSAAYQSRNEMKRMRQRPQDIQQLSKVETAPGVVQRVTVCKAKSLGRRSGA